MATIMKAMLLGAVMAGNLRRPLVPLGYKLQKDHVYDSDFPIDGNSKYEIIEKERLHLNMKLEALKAQEGEHEAALEKVHHAENKLRQIEAKLQDGEDSYEEAKRAVEKHEEMKGVLQATNREAHQQRHRRERVNGVSQGEIMKLREQVERFREEEVAAMHVTERLRKQQEYGMASQESNSPSERLGALDSEVAKIEMELERLDHAAKALMKKRDLLMTERQTLESAGTTTTNSELDKAEAKQQGLAQQREEAEKRLSQAEHRDSTVEQKDNQRILKDISERLERARSLYNEDAHKKAMQAAEEARNQVASLKKEHVAAKEALERIREDIAAGKPIQSVYQDAVDESRAKLEELMKETEASTSAPVAWNDPESWR